MLRLALSSLPRAAPAMRARPALAAARAWSATAPRFCEAHAAPTADAGAAFDPEIEALADQIVGLNLLQVSQLSDCLAGKLGVDLSAMMAPAAAAAPAGPAGGAAAEAEEPAEERTEFDVKLVSFPADGKLKVIKLVRTISSDLGLKEAKELVEGAPKVLRRSVPKEEADEILGKLKELGCEVALE